MRVHIQDFCRKWSRISSFVTVSVSLLIGVVTSAQDGVVASVQDGIVASVHDEDVVSPASACRESGVGTWRARADYLSWWTKGNAVPALVTTSLDGTSRAEAGRLGTPGVEVLFGADSIDDALRSGGRLTLTHWFDSELQFGLEGIFLYVGDDHHTGDFAATSPGSSILARPFFNLQRNEEDAELVAFPKVLEGRVDATGYSEIYSAELLLRRVRRSGSRGHIDLVGGYRYFRLSEGLRVREQLTSVDPGGLVPLGTQFDLSDQFRTENDFHGGEVGMVAEFQRSSLSLELLAKLAVGNLRRESQVSGHTTRLVPGLPAAQTPGGLLALPSNIGSRADNEFAMLPEFGINGTILLTERLSIVCGYSLLLLNHVARTGDQIDRVINTTQIGGRPLNGLARPAHLLADTDFWAQGVNIGLDYRW